jgi:hypothetical protein
MSVVAKVLVTTMTWITIMEYLVSQFITDVMQNSLLGNLTQKGNASCCDQLASVVCPSILFTFWTSRLNEGLKFGHQPRLKLCPAFKIYKKTSLEGHIRNTPNKSHLNPICGFREHFFFYNFQPIRKHNCSQHWGMLDF